MDTLVFLISKQRPMGYFTLSQSFKLGQACCSISFIYESKKLLSFILMHLHTVPLFVISSISGVQLLQLMSNIDTLLLNKVQSLH